MQTKFVGKLHEKKTHWNHRHRGEYNIKMDFTEIGCKGMNWSELAEDRYDGL
jgi:hypothetical protein